MKLQVFALHDRKADTWDLPIQVRSEAEAVRRVQHMARQPNTVLHDHAADFGLYYIGTYNMDDATCWSDTPYRFICDVSTLQNKADE